MEAEIISWIKANDAGDFASILGVVISLVGFVATLIGVFRAKSAAERAEIAAQSVRDKMVLLSTVVDFSAAISALEEIKRLHRQNGSWPLLPDRYSLIRKILIELRSSNASMTEEQSTVVQNAIVNLSEIEKQVEKSLGAPSTIKWQKFNLLLSNDIDGLASVLMQLKIKGSEGRP